ncbi:MAG: glycosyltransferase [Candidatus Pacebacteria bacterium]|nr:glycosyltransferase [Candidatus Paceibacterota bacterium]
MMMTKLATKPPQLTAIVIAKNEAKMISNCLQTLQWCDELLVIDNGSSDQTAKLAEDFGAKVIGFESQSFARLRDEGLKRAQHDWVFYLDADERVTPTLAKEIQVQLETTQAGALRIRRTNICYGKEFRHGGWQKDYVTRVFQKKLLAGWTGKVHESPVFDGGVATLQTPLIHLTHRNTTGGLKKTMHWTKIEAELLVKAKVSSVGFKTILRKGLLEFWRRAIWQRGYQDGTQGLIEALVQAINKFLIYIQVWELQQRPPLADQYQQLEADITKLWEQQ